MKSIIIIIALFFSTAFISQYSNSAFVTPAENCCCVECTCTDCTCKDMNCTDCMNCEDCATANCCSEDKSCCTMTGSVQGDTGEKSCEQKCEEKNKSEHKH